jgi:beta-galactosidase
MRVEEWFALGPDETRRVKLAGREGRLIGRYWTEAIHTDGAEVLATFSDSHLKGCPAFTSHIVGKGRALYLGSRFDDADVAVILDRLCCELSLEPVLKAPLGVEVTMRDGGGERFLFLLNHNQRPARISLGGLAGLELLTGRATARTVHLGPHGAAVINLMKRPDSKKSRPASKIA